ncbi:MAG: helix-turn-helix transcriptional regulator [Candidatus Omnitrophica bacterium]|nr:helix-turn-helix transcriptional regulator [Candidatus Omnitrophota bacterium]
MLEIIKEYRLMADLTYMQLAAMTGIKYQTLQKILTNKTKPNARTAYKITRFYNSHRSEIEAAIGHTQEKP